MNNKLDKIIEDFPELFRTAYCDYGCGDGWAERVIRPLCAYIYARRTDFSKRYTINFKFDQIKEKFGGLRLYYSFTDSVVDESDTNAHESFIHTCRDIGGAVSFAEYLADSTCEETGVPGKACSISGWHKTLSDEKIKEYRAKGIKVKVFGEESESADEQGKEQPVA